MTQGQATDLQAIQEAEERAIGRVERFGAKYGAATRALARVAAFAMTLTTDLLRCLRENFVPDAPWYGVADVLLGGLCEPIGHDLYEMDGAVRRVLLREVSREGLAELTGFMRAYVAARLQGEARDARLPQRARLLGDRPEWTALPYLYGDGAYGEAAAWEQIRADLLALVRDASQRERLHIMALVESYAQSLLPRMERPILQWVEAQEAGGEQTEAERLAAALGVRFEPVGFETAQVWLGAVPQEIDPTARQGFDYETVQLDRRGRVVQRETRQTWGYVEDLGGLGLEMVAIPGGEFTMGSPQDEPQRWDAEGPQHRVRVPPFFMGRYAVTQAQWRVVAGWDPVERELEADPAEYKGEDRPIDRISWVEAVEFCGRLRRETGRNYQLPSEAMWEYACRSRTETAFSFGPMISPEVANYDWDVAYDGVKFERIQTFEGTVPVGRFPANPWGLYEMHGNVWEWCADHWHDNYEGAPTDGSAWVEKNAETHARQVLRGGSWIFDPADCRSAARLSNNLVHIGSNVGFRLVCLPQDFDPPLAPLKKGGNRARILGLSTSGSR